MESMCVTRIVARSHFERRFEIEQMLLTPVAGEVLSDLFLRLSTALVTKSRQLCRVTLTGNDGADNAHAGLAREFTDSARPASATQGEMERSIEPVFETQKECARAFSTDSFVPLQPSPISPIHLAGVLEKAKGEVCPALARRRENG